MCWARVSSSTLRMVVSGVTVIGLVMMPASNFLTRRTSSAWRAGVRFLWIIPRPPSWARQIAARASVTVSMAADNSGILRLMVRVREGFRSTSLGGTLEWAGSSRTSSKVRASWTIRMPYYSDRPCFRKLARRLARVCYSRRPKTLWTMAVFLLTSPGMYFTVLASISGHSQAQEEKDETDAYFVCNNPGTRGLRQPYQ